MKKYEKLKFSNKMKCSQTDAEELLKEFAETGAGGKPTSKN